MTARCVIVHETCRHILSYSNNLAHARLWRNKLVIHGFKGFVIEERDATDAELMQFMDGERCGHCTIDGNLRSVLR